MAITTQLVCRCQYNVTSHLDITYSGKGCKTPRYLVPTYRSRSFKFYTTTCTSPTVGTCASRRFLSGHLHYLSPHNNTRKQPIVAAARLYKR